MSNCWPCRTGEHQACNAIFVQETECACTHDTEYNLMPPPVGTIGNALNLEPDEPESTKRTRQLKNDDSVRDQQSTGRKRAAALYPLKDENGNPFPCDFANKKAVLPNFMEVQIDGCGSREKTLAGNAQARHHHDYNTLNNERYNVGLLCHSCHNLLHAKNDPFKDKIMARITGVLLETENLKHANKALKSGVVSGGVIKGKEEFNL